MRKLSDEDFLTTNFDSEKPVHVKFSTFNVNYKLIDVFLDHLKGLAM